MPFFPDAIIFVMTENPHKKGNWQKLALISIFLLTAFLRFFQLGYSNFYPDETKTFHMRKDVAITDFLLNQRKGPVQFLVSWSTEKLFGNYDELYTRAPFALAGTLLVVAFYLFIKKLFNEKIATIATLLFSLNGFFIAFGRTAQYQSFLLLFAFISLFALLNFFTEPQPKKERLYLMISSVTLALAFLTHWDAIFIAFVIAFLLIRALFTREKSLKTIILFCVIPFVVILSVFYVPYFTKGYFSEHTASYITNRLTGAKTLPNNSFTTFEMYNPHKIGSLILASGVLGLFWIIFKHEKVPYKDAVLLGVIWFLIPFITFEIIFSSPGTHILNYIIPLIILAGYAFAQLDDSLTKRAQLFFRSFGSLAFCIYAIIQIKTFIPAFNSGYPWNKNINKDEIQLFLYGFPYNRGWPQIREYFNKSSIHDFATNDNIVTGKFYLFGVSAKKAKDSPEFYIYVHKNHQFNSELEIEPSQYELKEQLYVEGRLTAEIYKIIK